MDERETQRFPPSDPPLPASVLFHRTCWPRCLCASLDCCLSVAAVAASPSSPNGAASPSLLAPHKTCRTTLLVIIATSTTSTPHSSQATVSSKPPPPPPSASSVSFQRTMGLSLGKFLTSLFWSSREFRVVMLGLDAAGKTTVRPDRKRSRSNSRSGDSLGFLHNRFSTSFISARL